MASAPWTRFTAPESGQLKRSGEPRPKAGSDRQAPPPPMATLRGPTKQIALPSNWLSVPRRLRSVESGNLRSCPRHVIGVGCGSAAFRAW